VTERSRPHDKILRSRAAVNELVRLTTALTKHQKIPQQVADSEIPSNINGNKSITATEEKEKGTTISAPASKRSAAVDRSRVLSCQTGWRLISIEGDFR
jgi:hypothetical protein